MTQTEPFKITAEDLLKDHNNKLFYGVFKMPTNPENTQTMAEADAALINTRLAEFNKIEGPRSGDFIVFLDGSTRRLVVNDHNPPGKYYTSQGENTLGFHLWGDWVSAETGLYGKKIDLENVQPTDATRMGRTWTFHKGEVGVNQAIWFDIPYRVFRYTEPE